MNTRAQKLFFGRETLEACILGAMLLAAFVPTLLEMAEKWWIHPEYGHGLLMPPVAAWMIWDRRKELSALRRPGTGRFLPLLAALALVPLGAALVLGEMKLSWFLKPFAFFGALVACLAILYGWRGLRALVRPLVVLALMVPIPWRIVNWATVPLKRHAAVLATGLIDMTGLEAGLEGNLIHVPGIASLMVADACSGVRSLISLVAVAVMGCLFWKRHWIAKVLLVASTVPISILVNGLRIWSTAVLAAKVSPAAADEFWHYCEGLALFGVAALVLLGWGYVLHRIFPAGREPDAEDAPVSDEPRAIRPALRRFAVALSVALLAVASLGAYRMRARLGGDTVDSAAVARVRASLSRLPLEVPGTQLRGESKEWDQKTIEYSGADTYRSITYRDADGRTYEVYVASAIRNDENFHTPNVCLPSSAWELVDSGTVPFDVFPVRSESPRMRRLLLQKGKDQMIVYYWFQAGERMASDEWSVRWFRLVDLLRDAPLSPTLIVSLYVPVRDGVDATDRAARRFLSTLGPFLRIATAPGGIHG